MQILCLHPPPAESEYQAARPMTQHCQSPSQEMPMPGGTESVRDKTWKPFSPKQSFPQPMWDISLKTPSKQCLCHRMHDHHVPYADIMEFRIVTQLSWCRALGELTDEPRCVWLQLSSPQLTSCHPTVVEMGFSQGCFFLRAPTQKSFCEGGI